MVKKLGTNLVINNKRGKKVYYKLADDHVYTIFNQAISHVLEGSVSYE